MQARLAALQPPVLANRGFGQRAARPDGEQRERAERLLLASASARRARASGSRVPPGRTAAGSSSGRRSRGARDPRAPRAPSSPASSSTCRRRRCPRSRASRAALRRGSARAPSSTSSAWSRIARSCAPQWPGTVHHGAEMRPQLDRQQRGFVRPVLEDAPCAQQRGHGVVAERSDPRPDRQPVRAIDRGDRIELHRRQPADHLLDVAVGGAAKPRRVTLAADDEATDRASFTATRSPHPQEPCE